MLATCTRTCCVQQSKDMHIVQCTDVPELDMEIVNEDVTSRYMKQHECAISQYINDTNIGQLIFSPDSSTRKFWQLHAGWQHVT